jgi:hypothetical protein
MNILKIARCLIRGEHQFKFIRNIYDTDRAAALGGRSVWTCACTAQQVRKDLYVEPAVRKEMYGEPALPAACTYPLCDCNREEPCGPVSDGPIVMLDNEHERDRTLPPRETVWSCPGCCAKAGEPHKPDCTATKDESGQAG